MAYEKGSFERNLRKTFFVTKTTIKIRNLMDLIARRYDSDFIGMRMNVYCNNKRYKLICLNFGYSTRPMDIRINLNLTSPCRCIVYKVKIELELCSIDTLWSP